ncbi:hypothetical protein SAMN05720354_10648 [Nitrosospira sp. Nsp1]|nr:hypothetical protein SAMN05720354_10648 [Nitrosospira sp. Nsp1]
MVSILVIKRYFFICSAIWSGSLRPCPVLAIYKQQLARLIEHTNKSVKNRRPHPFFHNLTRSSRKALVSTDTELIAMAAPANIGESNRPKAG